MGTLPEADAAAFEEHLLVCARCMAAVAEAQEYVLAMESAARKLRASARKPKARAAR